MKLSNFKLSTPMASMMISFVAGAISLSAITAGIAIAAGAGATLVVEDPSPTRACTGVQTSGAIGTTQVTLTIPAVAGQYIYICTYDEFVGATTAPAATFLNTTTTNLGGLRWFNQVAATATGAVQNPHFAPAQPYKSAAPGTAVTIVSNAAVTSVNYASTVTYFYAP